MGRMAVDQDFAKRLQKRMVKDAAKFRRNPKEKGINAYAAHTQAYLARFGLQGFRNSMVARWVNGKIDAELEDETLKRLGVLWGYGRIDPSADPDDPNNVDLALAQEQAYLWLHGRDPGTVHSTSTKKEPPPSASQPNRAGDSLVSRVLALTDPDEIRNIAVAALDRLVQIVDTSAPEPEEEEEVMPTPLTYLLEGLKTKNSWDDDDLAKELNMTTARVQAILAGAVMKDQEECERVAELARLEVSTLEAWGACKISSAR